MMIRAPSVSHHDFSVHSSGQIAFLKHHVKSKYLQSIQFAGFGCKDEEIAGFFVVF
jgi:hypothetical protein